MGVRLPVQLSLLNSAWRRAVSYSGSGLAAMAMAALQATAIST